MKVLFTNTGPWGTGSFVVVEEIARELQRLDHRVEIFFPDNGLGSEDQYSELSSQALKKAKSYSWENIAKEKLRYYEIIKNR